MKIYLIAGEESGDLLGYNLMSGLKKIIPHYSFDSQNRAIAFLMEKESKHLGRPKNNPN